jgi:hypothetical protein
MEGEPYRARELHTYRQHYETGSKLQVIYHAMNWTEQHIVSGRLSQGFEGLKIGHSVECQTITSLVQIVSPKQHRLLVFYFHSAWRKCAVLLEVAQPVRGHQFEMDNKDLAATPQKTWYSHIIKMDKVFGVKRYEMKNSWTKWPWIQVTLSKLLGLDVKL